MGLTQRNAFYMVDGRYVDQLSLHDSEGVCIGEADNICEDPEKPQFDCEIRLSGRRLNWRNRNLEQAVDFLKKHKPQGGYLMAYASFPLLDEATDGHQVEQDRDSIPGSAELGGCTAESIPAKEDVP